MYQEGHVNKVANLGSMYRSPWLGYQSGEHTVPGQVTISLMLTTWLGYLSGEHTVFLGISQHHSIGLVSVYCGDVLVGCWVRL